MSCSGCCYNVCGLLAVKDQADAGFKMINATHDDEIKVKRVRCSLVVVNVT